MALKTGLKRPRSERKGHETDGRSPKRDGVCVFHSPNPEAGPEPPSPEHPPIPGKARHGDSRDLNGTETRQEKGEKPRQETRSLRLSRFAKPAESVKDGPSCQQMDYLDERIPRKTESIKNEGIETLHRLVIIRDLISHSDLFCKERRRLPWLHREFNQTRKEESTLDLHRCFLRERQPLPDSFPEAAITLRPRPAETVTPGEPQSRST